MTKECQNFLPCDDCNDWSDEMNVSPLISKIQKLENEIHKIRSDLDCVCIYLHYRFNERPEFQGII